MSRRHLQPLLHRFRTTSASATNHSPPINLSPHLFNIARSLSLSSSPSYFTTHGYPPPNFLSPPFPPNSLKMRRISNLIANALSRSPPKENGSPEDQENYQNAIRLLNSLQSNAATLAASRLNPDLRRTTSLPQTLAACHLSGLSLPSLQSSIPILHIAGTKGKGTTCCFTESLLRQAGLRTGFFSSPHLTSVRERIRINGLPLSEPQFALHFFKLYHSLAHLSSPDNLLPCEMPHYFRFLTILALHIFQDLQVDVIILETGIGGRYDTTNVIDKPLATAITSLGYEHQSILGHTLEEIAYQKAGIMKFGVPCFTVDNHPPNIRDLLITTADKVKCPLIFVPALNLDNHPELILGYGGGDNLVTPLNAGLALHLANQLLISKRPHIFPGLSTTSSATADKLEYSKDPSKFLPFQIRGLSLAKWDGRFQKIEDKPSIDKRGGVKITWFLDGAHTLESLKIALTWFNSHTSSNRALRLLIFNITGDRDPITLMEPLISTDIFDLAIFCPVGGKSQDNWSALRNGGMEGDQQDKVLEGCRRLARCWEQGQDKAKGVILQNAEEAVDYVRELGQGEKFRIQVLITGSLHLIGGFLEVLEPGRNDDTWNDKL